MFALTVGGGFNPLDIDDYDLVAAIRGAVPFAGDRDIPDALKYADLDYAPERALPWMRQQLGLFPEVSRIDRFLLPKERRGAFREMTVSDPAGDVLYRLAVSPLIEAIELALGPAAIAKRVNAPGPGWRMHGASYEHGLMRRALRRAVETDAIRGRSHGDIRDFFGSVQPSMLAEGLARIGASEQHIAPVIGLLEAWNDTWSVRGLPIGFESSSLLGNAFLIPVDRALEDAGLVFVRWLDDYKANVESHDPDCPWFKELLAACLASVALVPNDEKWDCAHDPIQMLRIGGVDPLLDALSSLLTESQPIGRSAVREMFLEECGKTDPSAARMRFGLRALASYGEPCLLTVLSADPLLLRFGPRDWGSAFAGLLRHRRFDYDWAEEVLTSQSTRDNAPLKLQLLLALSIGGKLPEATGDSVERLVGDSSESQGWMTLRVAAAATWHLCRSWKPGRATEFALANGDVQLRRATVGGLRSMNDSVRRNRMLKKLSTLGECAATVAWVKVARRVSVDPRSHAKRMLHTATLTSRGGHGFDIPDTHRR